MYCHAVNDVSHSEPPVTCPHPCCRRGQYHPCCGWGQRHHHLCRLLLCPLQNQSLYLLPPRPDHCLPPGRGGGGGKEERERRGRDILTLSHVALTSGIGVDELIHVPILNAYLSAPNCAL